MKRFCLTLAALACLSMQGRALENGLARTPPMGWNSWNKFGCNVSEDLIKSTADSIVSSGMKDAGYEYVVIDDCWQVGRDAEGNIQIDTQHFPNGMRALADYVHSKGLKFGLYSDAGTGTCQHRPGSRGYEYQDARQYAAWGVDYLKYDWCHHGTQEAKSSYETMRDALLKSDRPIVFSLCEWGSNQPWLWGAAVGNLWRSTGDIGAHWDEPDHHHGLGVLQIVDLMEKLGPYAGPGHWNDPDMLEIGNGKLTPNETRAHFSMWCLFAAPLIAGNDIRGMKHETAEVLLNKEAIAVDQDRLGSGGLKVRDDGEYEVWSKQMSDGGRAVALLNRSATTHKIAVSWNELGLPENVKLNVRDLWAHKDQGGFAGTYEAEVPSHGVIFVRLRPM